MERSLTPEKINGIKCKKLISTMTDFKGNSFQQIAWNKWATKQSIQFDYS